MKTALLFSALLAMSASLFFFAPHHRRVGDPFKACTLGEIYGQFFSGIPDTESPRIMLFLFLASAGVLTFFFPLVSVLIVGNAPSQGGWLLLGGVLMVVGAIVNFFAMTISHASFGWGSSSSSQNETPFIWIIPLYQLLFAAANIVVGVNANLCSAVSRWLAS